MRAVLLITTGHAAREAGERAVAALQNMGIPARVLGMPHDAAPDHATDLLMGAGAESSSACLLLNMRDDALAELTGRTARGLVIRADTDTSAKAVAGVLAAASVAEAIEFIVRLATNPTIAAGRAKLFQSAAADAYAAGKASAWPTQSGSTREVDIDIVEDVLPTFFRTRRGTGAERTPSVPFAPALRAVLSGARALATRDGRTTVSTEDLMSALVDAESNEASAAWVAAGGTVHARDVENQSRTQQSADAATSDAPVIFSRAAAAMIAAARVLASRQNLAQATTLSLAEAMAGAPDFTATLSARGVGAKEWLDAISLRDAAREVEQTAHRTDVLPSIQAPRASLRRLSEVSRLMDSEHPATAQLLAQQSRKSDAHPASPESSENKSAARPPMAPDTHHEDAAPADGFWLNAPVMLKTRAHDPGVEAVETASDALLDGLLVVCPTEHGYVVLSDATNAGAVARLTQLVNRDIEAHPLTVMIHSTHLARPLAGAGAAALVERIAEEFWPGPLTLVLPRPARSFRGVSHDDTIGLRIPTDYTALALLSMIGRPLAAAAALPRAARADGEDIAAVFGARVAAILDVGAVQTRADHATVLRVGSAGATEVLRDGAVHRDAIADILKGLDT